MITLDQAREQVGARVRYTAPQTPETRSRDGVITSVGYEVIFVRFQWQQPNAYGLACYPRNLVLIDTAVGP